MKITRRQLRQIINEEIIILESDTTGKQLPKEMTKKDSKVVISAVTKGDAAHEAIKSSMRQRYGPVLIESVAIEIAKDLDAFITANPGIDNASDISPEKLTEIKRAASKRALVAFSEKFSDDAVINAYIDDVAKRMGYSATPPTVKALFKRYLYDFTYQFVFGFIDNYVLVVAGAVLDKMLQAKFGETGYSGLIGGGIGNLISDVMGDVGGVAIEDAISASDWVQGMATDEQIKLAPPYAKLLMKSATTTGVAAGCIVGLGAGLLTVWAVGTAAVATGIPGGALVAGAAEGTVGGFQAVAAATITATTITVGAIALLVTAGILGTRWKLTQNVLDELTASMMSNANRRFKIRVSKLFNKYQQEQTAGEILLARWTEDVDKKLQEEYLLWMVNNKKDEVQTLWNGEMSLKSFKGVPDLNKNFIFEYISGMSKALGLANPNAGMTIDEARLQKLAGM
jgi:hypothetical protein